MIIKTENGTLQVSNETEIPLVLTNPFFTDQGSHTLPFSIPWCKHNLMVLGLPHRLNAKKLPLNIECSITTDVISESGFLNILQIEKNISIELSFLTREGLFWKWAKETKLRQINTPNVSIDITLDNFQNTLDQYIDNVWPDVDFAFFPIARYFRSHDYFDNSDHYNSWAYRKLCISNFQLVNNPGDLYRDDSDRTDPVSPFIYLNSALTWISNSFGYKIGRNFLASTSELKSIVILNGALNLSYLAYHVNIPNLLPNVSVIEFIQAIENNFCCRFFINGKTKTMDIISFNEIVESFPQSITGNINISQIEKSKSLSISTSKIDSPYSITNDFAINGLYIYTSSNDIIHDGKISTTLPNPDYITYPRKIVFSIPLQSYFYYDWHEDSKEEEWNYIPACIHSLYHNRETDLDSNNINLNSSIAPMVPVECRQFYLSGGTAHYFTYTILAPLIDTWDNFFHFEVGLLSENNTKTPICFSFNRGRIDNIPFPINIFNKNSFVLPCGSMDIFLKNGSKIPHTSIALKLAGENNLFDTFYNQLKTLSENSPNILNLSNAKTKDIISKNFFDKLYCDGNHIILDTINISITPFSTIINSIFCKTVKQYQDKFEPTEYHPATLSTAWASNVSSSSADLGGQVITDGGSPVTSRGIFLADRMYPKDYGIKYIDGAGIGAFVNTYSGLTPNTFYFYVTFAINSSGYCFGPQRIFKTLYS